MQLSETLLSASQSKRIGDSMFGDYGKELLAKRNHRRETGNRESARRYLIVRIHQ